MQCADTDTIYAARHVGLRVGVPIEAPALSVNRLCGSGFQAVVSGAHVSCIYHFLYLKNISIVQNYIYYKLKYKM